MQVLTTGENHEKPIDRELAEAIDPWLEHMRWRPDFEKWRNGRLWQETKQSRTLAALNLFRRQAGQTGSLAGLKVLDLGCGMGGLSVALAREGAEVQPYDYNPAYCAITRLRGKRYGLELQPVNGGGEHLPFPNEYFDLIVCMDVLEHVQQPRALLAETQRCLKPGGLLYITAINRFAFTDPHYHVSLVNWLPRRLATPYLKLTRRYKDNSRFTDRQTLEEMHYFRYGQLPRLAGQSGFCRTLELGELEWGLVPVSGDDNKKDNNKSKSGLIPGSNSRKARLARRLQKLHLMGPVYRVYRSLYKGTYQLLMIKP